MLTTVKKLIANQSPDAEKVLDKARRDLVAAASAQSIHLAGEPLQDLISALTGTIGDLEREIEAEAESVDRRRTVELRAARDKIFDQLTDAENLGRRIAERHNTALQSESEAKLKEIGAAAAAKRSEIHSHIFEMAPAMREIVAGAIRYRELMREFDNLNGHLERAGRSDLRSIPVWRDAPQPVDYQALLSFLWSGDRTPAHLTADFFKAAEWVASK